MIADDADHGAVSYRAARLAVKMLRVTLPQALHTQAGNRIELVTNLKAANALGLTIPQPLLSRADEGINE